jgi:hypothetical protein
MRWMERIERRLAAQQEAAATPAAAAPGGARSQPSETSTALARQHEPAGEHPFGEAIAAIAQLGERVSGFENRSLIRRSAIAANYTDEAVEGLEKFAAANGISDPGRAMAEFEKRNPPPEPVVSGGTNWAFFDQRTNGAASADNGLAELLRGDDEGFLRKSIPAALAEVRGQR